MDKDPFAQLRNRFVERCRGDLALLLSFRDEPERRLSNRASLIQVAHSLAGSGGTFGFPEVSAHASALETVLIDGNGTDADAATALDRLIAVLDELTGGPD